MTHSHTQKSQSAPHIAIIGGGYAGLHAIMTLRRVLPAATLTLIDPRTAFVHKTELAKSFLYSIEHFKTPFLELAKTFRFNHLASEVELNEHTIETFDKHHTITIDKHEHGFDDIILATGALGKTYNNTLSLVDLEHGRARPWLLNTIKEASTNTNVIFVGGGPTAVESALYCRQACTELKRHLSIHLLHTHAVPLKSFSPAIQTQTGRALLNANIECITNAAFQDFDGTQLHYTQNGQAHTLEAHSVWAFTGIHASPAPFQADGTMRFKHKDQVLEHVWVAGDVNDFDGRGLNNQTAQAAKAQGQHVAHNIKATYDGQPLTAFTKRSQGVFIDLADHQACGDIVIAQRTQSLPTPIAKATLEAIELRDRAQIAGHLSPIDALKQGLSL